MSDWNHQFYAQQQQPPPQGFPAPFRPQAFAFQQQPAALLGDFAPAASAPDLALEPPPPSSPGPHLVEPAPKRRRQTDASVIALPPSAAPGTKRPREPAPEDGGAAGAAGAGGEALKRACARCKSLKVRCQFKREAETCERCLRASHECVIPGKKQRKPPAKRETFISVIRDQADLIDRLLSHVHAHTDAPQGARKLESDAVLVSQAAARTAATLSRPPLAPPEPALRKSASSSTLRTEPEPDAEPRTPELSSELRAWLGTFPSAQLPGAGAGTRAFFADAGPEDSSSSSGEDAELLETDTEAEAEDADDARMGVVLVGGGAEEGEGRERKLSKAGGRGERMAGIPAAASPFGLMARMGTHKTRSRAGSPVHEAEGIAGEHFFRASPRQAIRPVPLAHEPPAILKDSVVTPALAEKLFQSYFTYINPSVSLLDDVLYTPQSVYWRSPLLFTVIVAITSRYDSEHPDLYPVAMSYARRAAADSFLGGAKRVEAVQAFILLALYPQPAARWEDDRCFLFLGHAIRLAVDMNLHHPATARARGEVHARELLNRTRCWLNCFNLDRSMGSQYGKSTIIRNNDWVSVHSGDWWRSSEWNMQHFDIHLCAYNAELRLIADFFSSWLYSDEQHPTGLNRNIDIEVVSAEYDDRIETTRVQWFALLADTDQTVILNRFRIGLLKLGYSFARLVVLSHGFSHAWRTRDGGVSEDIVNRCIRAATDVVSAMVDDIGRPEQRIYVRMASEAQLVFVAFACSFLIRLLHPRYTALLSPAQRAHTLATVERAIGFADAPDLSTDDGRGWSLYARFLTRLLADVDSKFKARQSQSGSAGSSPAQLPRGASASPLAQSPGAQYPAHPQSASTSPAARYPSPHEAGPSAGQYAPGPASLASLSMSTSPSAGGYAAYPDAEAEMHTPTAVSAGAPHYAQEYASDAHARAYAPPLAPAHGYYDGGAAPPPPPQWAAPPLTVPSQAPYYAPMSLQPFARFDHYAPPSSGAGAGASAPAQAFYSQSQHLASSLAFDGEFIRSMQSASAGAGQGMMPGFGWMEQVPPAGLQQAQGQQQQQQHPHARGGGAYQ